MIGGTDILLRTSGNPAALDACTRVLQRYWPQARFENALTGDKYSGSTDLPAGRVRELLVYRDTAAEAAWDAEHGNAAPNTMIYLILSSDCLTAVLDDPNTEEMQSILESMRKALQIDVAQRVAPSPTAAATPTTS